MIANAPLFNWRRFKEAVNLAEDNWSPGHVADPSTIELVEQLLEECRRDPDCELALVFSTASALVDESRHDWDAAIEHRKTELHKITRLHELAAQNPGTDATLIGYESEVVAQRIAHLAILKARVAR